MGQSLGVVRMHALGTSLILLQSHWEIIKPQSAHDTVCVSNFRHFSASSWDREHADSRNSHAEIALIQRVNEGRHVTPAICTHGNDRGTVLPSLNVRQTLTRDVQ